LNKIVTDLECNIAFLLNKDEPETGLNEILRLKFETDVDLKM